MMRRKTWTEVARRFSPPQPLEKFKAQYADAAFYRAFNRSQHGFTVIELRCDQTGELKFYEEYGDQTQPKGKGNE